MAAAATWVLEPPFIVVIGAAIVGFVIAMVITFKKTISPPLILTYGALEGVFVGGISKVYEDFYDGIVLQAVLGTLGAFASMLLLYRIGAIRATPRFQRILIIAGGRVPGVRPDALSSASPSTGGPASTRAVACWRSPSSAFGVVLASLFLVLDFDQIEQGIRNGAPQKFAWLAGFGLVVTLVWLYLEILRLISILRGD